MSRNFSYRMTVAGDGFICATRFTSSSDSMMGCWRFSGDALNKDVQFKRIYHGPALDQIMAGNNHICGTVKGSNERRWWQWEDFKAGSTRGADNFSAIAVGSEFVCGLTASGKARCLGNDETVIRASPSRTYRAIGAGFRHACAISFNGSLDCWGVMEGVKPSGQFMDLALGENRSCALRQDYTVICWGSNGFSLPNNLQQTYFTAITGKKSVFCGIVASNYSVLCWGNEEVDKNALVFNNMKPGACTYQCLCAPLPGSSSLCPPGQFICEPCFTQPSSSPSPPPPRSSKSHHRWSAKMVAFLAVGITGSICLVIAAGCFFLCRHTGGGSSRVHNSGSLEESEAAGAATPDSTRAQTGRSPTLEKRLSHILSMGNSSNLEEFSLDILLQVTDNFSEDHKVGSGSFGSVYRATLEDGREVAIKRAESSSLVMSNGIGLTKHREEKDTAFLAELESLSRLNHKNLVRLYGFYEDGNERVLVYEYLSNGALHEHIHKLKSLSPLASWSARIQVALDAARGIQYLHHFAVPPIIHRDIKSSNILLDENWTAKVSDLGLSLMRPDDENSYLSLQVAGTVGYMDPEYYRLQQLTTKSDVYSFGVVLLELLSGKKAIHPDEQGMPRNVVDLVIPYIVRDDVHRILDVNVPPPTPVEIEAVSCVGYLAADCVNPEGRDRPSMNEMVNCLERALTVCLAPPTLHWSSTTSSNTQNKPVAIFNISQK